MDSEKLMSASYSIKIDFDRTSENPERVFLAMAMYVQGFNELHESLIRGYRADLEFTPMLDKTRQGSCIADIKIRINDVIKRHNLTKIFDAIYEGVEEEISKPQKIDSENDVTEFTKRILQSTAANEEGSKLYTCDSKPNLIKIADALNKINNARAHLNQKDKVQIGRSDQFMEIDQNFSCPRAGKEIFADNITPFPSTQILIVRRPAYVKNLHWDFEDAKTSKKITAKITDQSWLDSWLNHGIQIWPGDAIKAKTVICMKGNKESDDKTFTTEITAVLAVIKKGNIEQFTLGLDDE